MGCSESKIENEEAVSRCKDRNLFMKDAVSARNAFAAAHSSYAMALKNSGAVLSDFAAGEALSRASHSVAQSAAPYRSLPPPPPPLPVIEIECSNGGLRKLGEEESGGTAQMCEDLFSVSEKTGGEVEKKMKEGKRNVNLKEMLMEVDDHFLKASESAHQVSKLLEATRLYFHSNFADNRGHIDHSARMMSVITWNRSFRAYPDNEHHFNDDFDTEHDETHATVLDKLLAWEKKLYDEVKAGEVMKFEYQKKVCALNKMKKRGCNVEVIEKAKGGVSHLHTRYIVDMQSMDSTVSEINRIRDEQLFPKLVQLVNGMATMWETMHFHHGSQSKIVSALKLLDISHSPKETTNHHHDLTVQLWAVIQEWHSQLEKLINHQKHYIKALSSWLRLNLIPTETSLQEKLSPPQPRRPPIQKLLHGWQEHLEKLPDEVLRNAIFTFATMIHTVMQSQEEEMKLKIKCQATEKELARKIRQFSEWQKKYVQRRPADDEAGPPENGERDVVAEKQAAVEMVEKRLEEEREEWRKQCLHVREKSLACLKNQLPELFRALSEFSIASSRMFRYLKSISQPNKSQNASVSSTT